MPVYFASKVDANQKDIVKALQAVGAAVTLLSSVGQGCPDLLVGWKGANWLMEVKDGRRPPSERKLTPAQEKWHKAWKGQVAVVTNTAEALAVIGVSVLI